MLPLRQAALIGVFVGLVGAGLAGCAGPPPGAEQRAATDLDPSGEPYRGPRLLAPETPETIAGSFAPFACHPEEDAGTVCVRQPR